MSDDKGAVVVWGSDICSIQFSYGNLIDMIATLDSGIKRKKIQLAYYLEREETVAAEIIDNQIRFGDQVLSLLQDGLECGRNQIESILEDDDD